MRIAFLIILLIVPINLQAEPISTAIGLGGTLLNIFDLFSSGKDKLSSSSEARTLQEKLALTHELIGISKELEDVFDTLSPSERSRYCREIYIMEENLSMAEGTGQRTSELMGSRDIHDIHRNVKDLYEYAESQGRIRTLCQSYLSEPAKETDTGKFINENRRNEALAYENEKLVAKIRDEKFINSDIGTGRGYQTRLAAQELQTNTEIMRQLTRSNRYKEKDEIAQLREAEEQKRQRQALSINPKELYRQ